MKRCHLPALLAPVASIIVATSFVACEKKTEKSQTEQAAPPSTKSTDSTAAAIDIAALRETYGLAARLPRDVEAFSSSFRLHELWVKLSSSNWSTTFLNLPLLKSDPKFQMFIQQWNTAPQAQMVRNVLDGLFGSEFVIVNPAGFTAKFMPWMDLIGEMQALNIQRGFMTAMSGGKPPDSAKLFREAAPDLIPALVKCDLPPVLVAFKAAKAKADIDAALGQFVQKLATQPPPGVELGKFKVADKHEFQNITVTAKKAINAAQEARLRMQLKEMLSDEAKAKSAMDALMTKKIEIAWGWMDDYLFISLGTDHEHLKFATSDADCALGIPVVARRAAQFAGKKPTGLAYAGAAMFEKLYGPVEFASEFNALSEELSGLLKPEHVAAMQADVKRLETKAQAVFTSKFDPLVSVSFWDGGIRGESFGGARHTSFDTTKPLGFGSLLANSVFLLADGRANPANTGKVADFLEDCATTLQGWYDKYGRTMIPENERQGAAMVEALALPMVKDLWRAGRQLSKALGDESALVLDLNGNVPKLPNLPPGVTDGKVPRMAWVSELKDRAGVSEAWKGFEKTIKQVTSFAPQGVAVPEPQMKKDGDVELHFIEPPIPTDDFLPHIAITKDRWIFSTSPSLSKEIATKPAASGGTPLGSEWRVQVPALCDLADAWMKAIDKDPKAFLRSAPDAAKYTQLRPTLGGVVRLMRSLSSIEWRAFDEGGDTRNSTFLKLEDVK